MKIAIGPPIENGFYYDFEFPEPIREEDLERIEAEIGRLLAEGRTWEREEITAAAGPPAVPGGERALQGRARRDRRGRDLPLQPGGLHRPLPRPAPAGLEADQGDQAHVARRGVLARRRAEHAADADLRHGVLLPGRPRRVPRAARGGEGARPPQARPRARPLPLRRALAGLAVLAPEGDGALQRARGPAPPRERAARLPRGEDAADLRQGALGHVGPLGEVPREHVPDPADDGDEEHVYGDQADELPGPHAALRQHAPELPRPAAALRRGCAAAPQRAGGRPPRPHARALRDAGRRAHLLLPRADRRGARRRARVPQAPLRPLRASSRVPSSRRGPTTSSARTRSGTSPRASSSGRSTATRSRTSSARGRGRSTARRSTSTSPTRSVARGSSGRSSSTRRCRAGSASPTWARTTWSIRSFVIHRAFFGSFERFIGILIEHYGGAFPFWLAPVQVRLIPVGEGHRDAVNALRERVEAEGFRVDVDERDETLGKRIRDAELREDPVHGRLRRPRVRRVARGSRARRRAVHQEPRRNFLPTSAPVLLRSALKAGADPALTFRAHAREGSTESIGREMWPLLAAVFVVQERGSR